MKIEIHISDDKKSFSIAVDGAPQGKMESFVLLTMEGDRTRNVVFGGTENVGRLLYSLYINCLRLEETDMRNIIEMVSDDILDIRQRREDASRETLRRIM